MKIKTVANVMSVIILFCIWRDLSYLIDEQRKTRKLIERAEKNVKR